MAKVPGSIWVEGITLRFVDKDEDEWSFTGTLIGAAAGSVNGSIWITTTTVRYIANNQQYQVPSSLVATRSGSVAGSIWVANNVTDNTALRFISSGGVEYMCHSDVAHSDSAHGDATHVDNYEDMHGDYDDPVHADGSHIDFYQDHDDESEPVGVEHADAYYDLDSGESATIHHDAYTDNHDDIAHSDSAHSDTAHTDNPSFIGAS